MPTERMQKIIDRGRADATSEHQISGRLNLEKFDTEPLFEKACGEIFGHDFDVTRSPHVREIYNMAFSHYLDEQRIMAEVLKMVTESEKKKS